MGQCISSLPQVRDPPEEFKRRWAGSEVLDGAYRPTPAYTTTANVGMGNHDRFGYGGGRLALDPIDEHKTVQGGITTKNNNNKSPTRNPRWGADDAPPESPRGEMRPNHQTSEGHTWKKGELIGQGAYGSVFLGLDQETGQLMAVKAVQVPRSASQKIAGQVASLEAEVKLLRRMDHPNIVRYLYTERTEEALHIFLEYVPGGSIASLVTKFGSLPEPVIKVYTRQILTGLEYLHAHGIIHRDIKGGNILVDISGNCKLADFGASKQIEELATLESGFKSVKGTPYWMAPEIIKQSGHGRQADIWSVACTVIEMATGRPPWSELGSQVAAMFQIASSKGPPIIPEHLSAECKDFLYLCFNRNWKDRPLAAQLLRHPFLAGPEPQPRRMSVSPLPGMMAATAPARPSPKDVLRKSRGDEGDRDENRESNVQEPGIIKAWRTPPKSIAGTEDEENEEKKILDSSAGLVSESLVRPSSIVGVSITGTLVSIQQDHAKRGAWDGNDKGEEEPADDDARGSGRFKGGTDAKEDRGDRSKTKGQESVSGGTSAGQKSDSDPSQDNGEASILQEKHGKDASRVPAPLPVRKGSLSTEKNPLGQLEERSHSESVVLGHGGKAQAQKLMQSVQDFGPMERAVHSGRTRAPHGLPEDRAVSARHDNRSETPQEQESNGKMASLQRASSERNKRPSQTSQSLDLSNAKEGKSSAKLERGKLETMMSERKERPASPDKMRRSLQRQTMQVEEAAVTGAEKMPARINSPQKKPNSHLDGGGAVSKLGGTSSLAVAQERSRHSMDRAPAPRAIQVRQSMPILSTETTDQPSSSEVPHVTSSSPTKRKRASDATSQRARGLPSSSSLEHLTDQSGAALVRHLSGSRRTESLRSSTNNPLFEEGGEGDHMRPNGGGASTRESVDGDSALQEASNDDAPATSTGERLEMAARSSSEAWVLHCIPPSPMVETGLKARRSTSESEGERDALAKDRDEGFAKHRREYEDASQQPKEHNGSNQSTYNPMDEPSWIPESKSGERLASVFSKLATTGHQDKEETALNGDVIEHTINKVPEQRPRGHAQRCSLPSFLRHGGPASLGASWEVEAAVAAAAVAHRQRGTSGDSPEVDLLGSWCPPQDHLVWTNDDGDIDALPWDVGRSSLAFGPGSLLRASRDRA